MSRRAIVSRISKLEKGSSRGECAVCSGAGRIVSIRTHEEAEPAEPEGCPGCGRITIIRVTRVSGVIKNLSMAAQVRYC